MPKQKFFVPTIDLGMRIKEGKKADLEGMDFTILYHGLNAHDFYDLALINACSQASPKVPIRDLIALNPERLLKNEIIAQLQAKVQLDLSPDDDYASISNAINRMETLLQPYVKNLETSAHNIYSGLEPNLANVFHHLKNGLSISSLPFSADEQEMLSSTFRTYHAHCLTHYSDNETEVMHEAICLYRWQVILYNKKMEQLIAPLVNQAIDELSHQGKLNKLEIPKRQNSLAIFTTGGVASGKGSTLKHIASVINERPIAPVNWHNIVHHNADKFKPFLFDASRDNQRFSQYTYEEALCIKERTMAILSDTYGASEEMAYPHFLHDQTKLKGSEIVDAANKYGAVIIAAVSTDAESAIERAYKRGEETNRFEHTEGLLGSHKAVPKFFIDALKDQRLQKKDISVAMYDNNHPDKNLRMFATIDMNTAIIKIENSEYMERWIKKLSINPNASHIGEIYSNMTPVPSIEEYFQPLIDFGFTLILPSLDNTEDEMVRPT